MKNLTKITLLLMGFLSLISYNPNDPSIFNWSSLHSSNYIGYVGSYFSDIVINLFGYASILVIIYPLYLMRYPLEKTLKIKIKLFLLILSVITPLMSVYMQAVYPNGPGGIMGSWLGWHMLEALGHVGLWCFCFLILINVYVNLIGEEAKNIKVNVEINKKRHSKLDAMLNNEKIQKNIAKKLPEEHDTLPLHLLSMPKDTTIQKIETFEYQHLKQLVEAKLSDFSIDAEVVDIIRGPVITRLELTLAAGTKASRLTSISKDLARSMSVPSIRVVEVIPGKSCVGIELPNQKRQTVFLGELISSPAYTNNLSPLSLVLGKDISGMPVVVDLMKMPHLLVAGTTGSGKSVGINTMLLSLLYKSSPEQLKLILIDPKMLELAIYGDIPHLLTPVVTDMNDAASALRWSVSEMERRYQIMAALGVRNIQGYNAKIQELRRQGNSLSSACISEEYMELLENVELTTFPYLVIVADEFADMMMVVGKKVEQLIARLAQKARAAGIHLILATQRPSVDVITGLIKANIPTRIAFQVSSKIDSRTILDQQGAEALLGSGDMLYLPPGTGLPVRIHGAFVSDNEVHEIVKYFKKMGKPNYINLADTAGENFSEINNTEHKDALMDEAIIFVRQAKRVSISSIQRRFRIGYNRAATIVESMEAAGIVTPPDEQGLRRICMHAS